jgi:hypothetical protein
MKSILFIQSQTLYAKATIPVAIECVKNGLPVTFQVNRPVFLGYSFGFSDNYIKNNPTSVGIINPHSLQYVADVIGLGEEWRAIKKKINFSFTGIFFPKRFLVVVGTTKNMDVLNKISNKGVNTFALGYQHLPVFLKVNKKKFKKQETDSQSVFFSDNEFSNDHKFENIVKNHEVTLSGFTYLDNIFKQSADASACDKVLIFHPGGYRGVVSSPGDSKDTCYRKQKDFLNKLCVPLISKGLKPVVKIHPLRALYHDFDDLIELSKIVENENNLPNNSIQILGPKEWVWSIAFNSCFVITFGSSAVYELWSLGIKNVYVCGFISAVRSQRFNYFDSVFIDSIDKYNSLINNPEINRCPSFDEITNSVFSAYNDVSCNNSVELVTNEILKEYGFKKININSILFSERPDIFIFYEWVRDGLKENSPYIEYVLSTRKAKKSNLNYKKILLKTKKFIAFLEKNDSDKAIAKFFQVGDKYIPINLHRTGISLNKLGEKTHLIGKVVNKDDDEVCNKTHTSHYISRVKRIAPDSFDDIMRRAKEFEK